MEHQTEDVPLDGTLEISNDDIITYVDDRVVFFICAIGVIMDIALIIGVVSCVRHIAKWVAPH